VKTTVAPTSTSVPVQHLSSDDWKSQYRARFEARHRYESHPPPIEHTLALAASLYPQATGIQKVNSMISDELSPVLATTQPRADHVEYSSTELGKALRSTTPPLPDADHYVDEEFVADRQPSPFFDMTSAVRYNESKALMTGAVMDSSPSGRSRLSIDAIIHNTAATPEPEIRKRKADDISDVLKGEVRAWGSSSSAPLNTVAESQNTTSRPESPTQSNLTPAAAQEPPESTSAITDQPSLKRLKRVAEGAAYIALGGVGLFSILVATAPDFL